jgi:NTP pyrophosphatase (non-canonical NTP hydrolase)
MNPSTEQFLETLGILQEECAEAIVEASKIRRFGLDTMHYKTGATHRQNLETELGDVLAMIDILVEQGIVNKTNLDAANKNKKEKLKKWSTIYEKN